MSAKIKAEKIAKGLCYLCDKPYAKGHKCGSKEPQFFAIEVLAAPENEEDEMMDMEYESQDRKEPCISLHALIGEQTYHTMRIVGFVKNKPFHILVDSESTHNNLEYVRKLGCELEQISPQVTIADRNKIACQYKCKNFTWLINGTVFRTDALLIPIGSCDMVLGIQWLRTFGEIYWNFPNYDNEISDQESTNLFKGDSRKEVASC